MPQPERASSRIRVYLASGAIIETWDHDEKLNTVEDVVDHISDPPKPHWSIIGDAVVFTQAVAGIELA